MVCFTKYESSAQPQFLNPFTIAYSTHMLPTDFRCGDMQTNFTSIGSWKLRKKAIRAITFSKYREHSAPIFKKLEILKLQDLVYLKTASLLWDLNKGTLPLSLSSYFTRANSIHEKNTRFAKSGNLKICKDSNSFQSIGIKIFNDLNDKQSFSASNKKFFLDRIKSQFILNY